MPQKTPDPQSTLFNALVGLAAHTDTRFNDPPGWDVTVAWLHRGDGLPLADAPDVLVVTPNAKARGDARARGLTTGVFRRLERLIPELRNAANPKERLLGYADAQIRAALRKMPETPRTKKERNAFYHGLLHIHGELEKIGHPRPGEALAASLGRPVSTVRSQLAVARKRAEAKNTTETEQ